MSLLQVNSWSGSVEIGVTALDPACLDFPSSATGLKGGSWIVSGCSVLRDGRSVLEEYGRDLDQLAEGDRVGIQVSRLVVKRGGPVAGRSPPVQALRRALNW